MGQGEENWKLLFNGYRASMWDSKKVLEMESGDSYKML